MSSIPPNRISDSKALSVVLANVKISNEKAKALSDARSYAENLGIFINVYVTKVSKCKDCCMNYHLVGIYKDKQSNILLIPTAQDKDGIRRDISDIAKLGDSNDYNALYSALKESFSISKESTPLTSPFPSKVFEVATGIKSYKAFSKHRKYLAAMSDSLTEIKLIPSRRENDGSYSFLYEKEQVVNYSLSSEELGLAINNAFEYCIV
ncbi:MULTISPECIES: hypothetical protein [unclassified Paenibacillus]|uniref:hypothetical protein n=1 Tax=unclassified Paenibacillus TaxID=185978 RepID=UPI003635B665